MQKGKVNQRKLGNTYHTAIFDNDHCSISGDKRVVAIDTNTEANGEARYVWIQIENKLNGGSSLLGRAYVSFNVTDSDKMKTDAIDTLTGMGVPVTMEQINTIFEQNGYLEPTKIEQYGDRDTKWLNRALDNASPEDFHDSVRKIATDTVNRMSMSELIKEAKDKLTKEGLMTCLEKIAVKEADEHILRDRLTPFADREVNNLKERGVIAQARFLLSHNVSINKILNLAGTEKFVYCIKLGGLDSEAKEDYMRIMVRTRLTNTLLKTLQNADIQDWVMDDEPVKSDEISATVDFDLDACNGFDLVKQIKSRINAFKKEHLAAATSEQGSFYFHCETGEVYGLTRRGDKLISSSDGSEFPYALVDVKEFNNYYQETINPGDEINILDLAGTTPTGKYEEAEQDWRDELKRTRDEDSEFRIN